ncbi:hypothetical protein [Streptomyces durocortorensis]|uniref:DUF8175 domain-containing protein n=1 Tax=Streptomyces durocortorensis TaxID=2811104 RepID=A0ABS2I7H6_9ACTN|nr:hypothetical protein [Streptomyces durocortorensis]MBM7058770.1 hypothetical protein [Streptomyces durocortorensis]
MNPRNSSGEWEKPFWQQPGWLLSAGFFLVLALLGAFVVFADDEEEKAGPGPRATAASSAGPAQGTPSGKPSNGTEGSRPAGCRTDDSDQAVPPKSPADLKWKVYRTDLVPVSTTAGPLLYKGAVWSCFARTPLGAVLALHSITSKMSGSEWRTVADQQVARGPGKDAFVATRSKEADESAAGAPGSDGTYVGFSMLTYTKDQATAMLLIRIADGKYGAATASVVWEDGDWKLRPTLNGSLTENITFVGGPEGFALWGGEDGA